MRYLLIMAFATSFGASSGFFLRPRLRTIWLGLVMRGILSGVCFSFALLLTSFHGLLGSVLLFVGGAFLIAGFVYMVYIVLGVRLHNAAFCEERE